jgi:glycosyltransferase involved in cell wall biosynthesis
VSRGVTVAVVVKDRRERMSRCLDALLAQDHDSFEVLVCDNGSTDGTAEMVRERAAAATVPVRIEHVRGTIGQVRNQATRMAEGSLVAFTDSDCLPAPDWLSRATAPFADDPGLGVVTGVTLPEDEPPLGRWAATLEIREQTWRFETCNAVYRREALLGSEGFDEAIAFGEDTSAGWSVLRGGWRAGFAPDAVVRHDVTYPGLRWHLRKVQSYGDTARVMRRYPEGAERLLWGRWFYRPRNAKLVAAMAGVALAPLDRRALLLAAPYAWFRRPRRPTPRAALDSAEGTVYDLAILLGLVRGSIRNRRLVL